MKIWQCMTEVERLEIWREVSKQKDEELRQHTERTEKSAEKKKLSPEQQQRLSEIRAQHQSLLESLSDEQIANFWVELPVTERVDLYKAMREEGSARINRFWHNLPYETKQWLLS